MIIEVKSRLERLQKVIAHAGIASRRKAELLIQEGRVKVNGKTVTELGVTVDPNNDYIEVDGQAIASEKNVYYLFNKPTGVITSVKDPQGRKVVTDYFKHIKERIYPVGRLDYDTSGLLVLTNDGELAHRLMHPSFHVHKTYRVTVHGIPNDQQVNRLIKGIMLDDGLTAPAQVERIKSDRKTNRATLKITIHEGRNRQVRLMFRAIGHRVLALHREKYGFLTLKGIQEGEYRHLSRDEVKQLKALASHNFHN